MNEKHTPAQSEYDATVEDLIKFCDTFTDLTPIIRTEEYPLRVTFVPNVQMSMFGNENVDENGEVNDMTITCGLSTSVKSTLKFEMDSTLLKKLIKLSEKLGYLYYHAFRESHERADAIDYGDGAFKAGLAKLRELCEGEEAEE